MLPTPFANVQATEADNAYDAEEVDLSGAWESFWSALPGDSGVWNILTVIGVALVVFALLSYLWQHRRGTGWGNGFQIIVGMLIVGGVMMAPSLLIPLFLNILDFLINFFIGIFEIGED